ncbi:MAG: hypothetical protein ACR2G6_00760 [Gemmatimonadaceae bacterium]
MGTAAATTSARRRYALDPWGMAYWIRIERPVDGERRILVYSFGPNRRRDGRAGEAGSSRGDDIVVVGMLTR